MTRPEWYFSLYWNLVVSAKHPFPLCQKTKASVSTDDLVMWWLKHLMIEFRMIESLPNLATWHERLNLLRPNLTATNLWSVFFQFVSQIHIDWLWTELLPQFENNQMGKILNLKISLKDAQFSDGETGCKVPHRAWQRNTTSRGYLHHHFSRKGWIDTFKEFSILIKAKNFVSKNEWDARNICIQ